MEFTILFLSLCGIYLIGWLFCCVNFFRNQPGVRSWGERLLFLGLCTQLFFIVASYIELGDFLFDSLSGLFLFLSLLLILTYFILNFYFPNQIFKIIFPPLTIFFLLVSILISDQVIIAQGFLDKSPVFGKFVLYVHASCSMLGYLLFGVACLASIFFLYQDKQIKNKTLLLRNVKIPSLGFLDSLNYKVITAGFLFLTVGLLLGVIMKTISTEGAPQISMRQILPFSTWGLYAFFLIDRSISGLRGKATAVWAIVGFAAAVTSFVYEISLLIQQTP
ncbi:MAG: cytochrome c biogenesis protein CcsA [Proteobacteria bacterium]|nr:cytochrome c biogenesis protein CcsA [Pseudomonadota bacterium]